MTTIGDRLKFEREKRGLSQHQMASIVGMAQSQYNRIEKGIQNLTIDKLVVFATEFDLDLHYMITGKYKRLDYGLDKMPVHELRKLMNDIFNEIESRMSVNQKV